MPKIHIKNAFSLVEVMLSILLLSVILVAMAPMVTKKISPKGQNGIVYTYRQDNNTNQDNVCFATNIATGSTASYVSTRNCSEYTFTVPIGVNSINLTLVAGGGGGGGAAGGTMIEHNVERSNLSKTSSVYSRDTNDFYIDLIKSIRINYLTEAGEDGGAENTDCNPSGVNTRCGGKGGKSSPAIAGFYLPKEYLRGYNYKPTTLVDNVSQQGALVLDSYGESNYYNTGISVGWGALTEKNLYGTTSVPTKTRTVKYGIQKINSEYLTYCDIAGEVIYSTDAKFYSKCKLSDANYMPSIDGKNGQTYNSEWQAGQPAEKLLFTSGHPLAGGAGGRNIYTYKNYGTGGKGRAIKLVCNDYWTNTCNVNNAYTVVSDEYNNKAGGPYASVTFTIERAGGVGAGGAGGTLFRILNLPVTPNETYIVRVGKGGAGGAGGISSANPQDGTAGEGGVSTAIYKVSGGKETLLYMVNGGAGGPAGSVWQTGKEFGASGVPATIKSAFFVGDGYENFVSDSKIATSVAKDVTAPKISNSEISTNIVSYKFLEQEPYKTLLNQHTVNYENSLAGLADFENPASVYKKANINGVNRNDVYDGFLYKTFAGGKPAYVGKLGGFSGLGTKAGCGGYFLGNYDAIRNYTDLSDNEKHFVRNHFLLPRSDVNNGTLYPVSEYYDNCTIDSPNGQSAEFIEPNPRSLSFGQAGSGGGGGGYSVDMGAGSGGDGQNGYLMIDWKK